MSSALREVLAHFGVEVEGKKELESLEELIDGTSSKLKKLGQVLAGGFLIEKVEEFFGSVIQTGAALKVTSERLGVTTDELQKFQLAAQLSGTSADAAADGLRFLNRNMGEATAAGQSFIQVAQGVNIHLKNADGSMRSATDVVGDLAEAMKDAKSQGERTSIAMKLLGRGGAQLLPMLQGGREELESMFGAVDEFGGGVTEQFAEDAHSAHSAIIKWQFAMQGLKTQFAADFLPYISEAALKLGHWVGNVVKLSKQTHVLKTALIAMLAGPAIHYFRTLLKMYKEWRKESELNWRDLIKIGLKWILIGAVIAAVYLIFDSLYTLWEGGDSVIGKLIDKMYGVGTAAEVVREVKDLWQQMVDIVGPSIPLIEQMGASLLKAFADALPYALKFVVIIGSLLSAGVKGVIGSAKALGETLADIASAGDGTGKFGEGDLAGRISKDWSKNLAGIGIAEGQLIAQTWNAPAPRVTSTVDSGPGQVNVGRITFNNENNISGVAQPGKVGEHIGKATRKAIDNSALRSAFAGARIGQ